MADEKIPENLDERIASLRGLDAAARLIAQNLGPFGGAEVLNSEVFILFGDDTARYLRAINVMENVYIPETPEFSGARLLMSVLRRMENSVGDGTATAAMLTFGMIPLLTDALKEGRDPNDLGHGLVSFYAKATQHIMASRSFTSAHKAVVAMVGQEHGMPAEITTYLTDIVENKRAFSFEELNKNLTHSPEAAEVRYYYRRVRSAQSGIASGFLPGAGLSLFNVPSDTLHWYPSDDRGVGEEILSSALAVPSLALMQNAKRYISLRSGEKYTSKSIIDLLSDSYAARRSRWLAQDVLYSAISDPYIVVQYALESAVAAARLFLAAEASGVQNPDWTSLEADENTSILKVFGSLPGTGRVPLPPPPPDIDTKSGTS